MLARFFIKSFDSFANGFERKLAGGNPLPKNGASF